MRDGHMVYKRMHGKACTVSGPCAAHVTAAGPAGILQHAGVIKGHASSAMTFFIAAFGLPERPLDKLRA